MQKKFLEEEKADFKKIFHKLKNRDFGGSSGQLIKNSSWLIASTFIAKVGSLIFTIIIARLMLPELYGLYGLALSTILFFGVFCDFGIGTATITFVSRKIDKNPGKAKGYFYFLTKYKIYLTLASSLAILLFAKWISRTYYNKPIFYAVIAGALYLPIMILSNQFLSLFSSRNDFRVGFVYEIIVQASRLAIVPLSILYFLSRINSTEFYLLWIFILLSFCNLLGGIYLLIPAKSRIPFEKSKMQELNADEKKDLKKFIIPLSLTALSGFFFGFIDQIMLGRYVESQFLAFYQVALNLVASASGLLAFSNIAVFPIFSRLKGEALEKGFKKTRNITILISALGMLFAFIFSPLIIRIFYGVEYSNAVIYLQILSILIITYPLLSLYEGFYTSQKKTKIISAMLISSTILNIFLNYFFIKIGLSYSMSYAVMGACIATVISRLIYLAGVVIFRNNQ